MNSKPQAVADATGVCLAFTKLTNTRGLLTKQYSLDGAGRLQKTTNATLATGRAETVHCAGLAEFMAYRATLAPSEALTYGVTGFDRAEITTQEKLRPGSTQIARDRKSFHFARAPGVLMLDHDAEHCAAPHTPEGLRATLFLALPELATAAMAWATSASSNLTNDETGEELQGLRGQRLYLALADASDVRRAGTIIYERLWAHGIGAFVVSKAGALLDRNLVDASAWQPERIDFAAGAACIAPVVQRPPPWRVWADPMGDADPWDSRALLPDLTPDQIEAAARHRGIARAAVAAEAKAARAAFIEGQAAALVERTGIDSEAAHRLMSDAVNRQLLFSDFMLHPERGGTVTVGEVLDNRERWHGARFADPIEPDYRRDKRIAWVNLRSGGRPYLFSHAHGLSQRYELVRQPATLLVQPGEIPRLADECLRVARELGDLYDYGSDGMARVADGQPHLVTQGYLIDYLGRHVRFERHDPRARKGEPDTKPTDCPEKVAGAIMERTGERRLPKLRGVITAPTLRADGTPLDVPGYDASTGLLYVSDDPTPPRVAQRPGAADVTAAALELLAPIQHFPFADNESRGVAVAAMLTAAVRRSLPTAPAFAFDAPTPGTGKSALAKVVLALGGHSSASHKPPATDEEAGKVLFAALRAGAGAIFFDNFAAPVGGPAFDQFLTAEEYAGRVLGVSTIQTAMPNGALVLFSGNNLTLMGDTCRRVLTCRLDARVEHPSRRSFPFHPEQYVRARRLELVRAALTVLRGFVSAGATLKGRPLGSFEAWDALVRQCVCWLADTRPELGLADPNATTETHTAADDGREVLSGVLLAWRGVYGDSLATAADVIERVFPAGWAPLNGAESALQSAIGAIARHPREAISARRLGNWLRMHRDRLAGNYRFESVRDRDGVAEWFVAGGSAGSAGSAGSVSPPSLRSGNVLSRQWSELDPADPADPANDEFAEFRELA